MRKLELLHRRISRCRACAGILPPRQLKPRSGFPPAGQYGIVVVGAEPGPSATDRPTPQEYKQRFDPRVRGKRNTVRRLFRAMETAGIPFDDVFFTNAVKCCASHTQSRRCYRHCQAFLHQQIDAVRPKVLIVFGRAANRLGLGSARKGEIRRTQYHGVPCLLVTHPQGAADRYLKRVGWAVMKMT